MKQILVVLSLIFGVFSYVFSQSNGDYQSRQDGAWSNASTWQVFNGGWQNLEDAGAGIYQNVIPTSSSGAITILNTHNVSIPNGFAVTIDQTTIAATGRITVSSGGTLTVANLANALVVNGSIVASDGSSINNTAANNIAFNDGAFYYHFFTTTEGTIPLATWDDNSTFEVRGYTTFTTAASTRWTQSFGHVRWNCAAQTTTVNLAGLLRTITGNFEIVDTNTGILQLSAAQRPTINITGNLEIEGSSAVIFSTGGASPGTIVNIGGNFAFTPTNGSSSYLTNTGVINLNIAGDFSMDAPSSSLYLANNTGSAGSGVLNITGDFVLQSGTILEGVNDAATSTGRINFVTTGTGVLHNYTNSGTIANRVAYRLVSANDTLHIQGESQLIGHTGSSYTQSGGVLIIESVHPSGAIQTGSGTGEGNIRTATRTFSSGSQIIYRGSAAQVMGNGQPSTASVIIDNPSGVTVDNPSLVTVSLPNLTINQGDLLLTNNNLSVNTATSVLRLNGGNIIANSDLAARSLTARQLILSGGSIDISGTTFAFTFTVNSDIQLLDGDISFSNAAATGTFNTFGEIDLSGGDISLSSGTGNLTTTVRGDITGSGFFLFSGSNNNFSILGSGALSRDFPINAATTLENLTLNRAGATVNVPYELTVLNNFTIRASDVNMSQDLYVGGDLNIAENYTLNFDDRTLELRSQFNNSVFGGYLSANAASTLLITGSGALDTLFFAPSGNTLRKLVLNRPTTGTLVRLTTALNIVDSLVLSDGIFQNVSGLTLENGAVLIRNSAASLSTAAPAGGPYNLVYSGTTLTTGFESQGSIENLTSQCTGTVTLGSALNVASAIEITSGTLTSGANSIIATSIENDGTFNAPSTNITLTGDFTNNGTFNRNNGTVNFNGNSSILGTVSPIFQHVTIQADGTLNSPALLELRGHLTNHGSFVYDAGDLVRFSGTARQDVSGSNPIELPDVQITNVVSPYSVSIEGTVNLAGVLTLGANAKLLANGISSNGVFTILSIDDQPVTTGGAIAAIPTTANIIGPITVQRYMSGKTKKVNRYISSPVSGATVGDIISDYNVEEVKYYDETALGTEQNGYTVVTGGHVLQPGRGYLALPTTAGVNALWDVRGQIVNGANRGNVNFNITHTASSPAQLHADGWNLVGNPYPANIGWGINAGWTRQNIGETITVRDLGGASPGYKTYTYNAFDGTGTLPNGVIALGQAFWVYAYPDPTPSSPSSGDEARLIVHENAKTTMNGTFYRQGKSPSKQMVITVVSPTGAEDDTFLKTNPSATSDFDRDLDALQFKNDYLNVCLLDEHGRSLLMHTLPTLDQDFSAPLVLQVTETGTYNMKFEAMSFSDAGLYLIDEELQIAHPISSSSSYSFFVNSVGEVRGRFRLSKRNELNSTQEALITLFPNPVKDELNIHVPDAERIQKVRISILDSKGISVFTQEISTGKSLDTSNLRPGVYVVKMVFDKKVVLRKIVKE